MKARPGEGPWPWAGKIRLCHRSLGLPLAEVRPFHLLLLPPAIRGKDPSPGQAAQLLELSSVHQRVVGLVPSRGVHGRQRNDVSLPHRCFSLSLKSMNISLGEN